MKQFDYLAVAYMGVHGFAIAGTIEIKPGENGYVAVRKMLLADPMYDRVESVKKANYSRSVQ